MARIHTEAHRAHRIGWLRAAVLGANDGTISVSSLVVGVAAAGSTPGNILLTGVAGLVAGAMSMAAGEYVSVSSQADTEKADLAKEKHELETDAAGEREELTNIYVKRGLDRQLAEQVADQLMAKDPLAAHARDELGISEITVARPAQAAFVSALAFSTGAAIPLIPVWLAPANLSVTVAAVSLACLALLGGLAAKAGGAPVIKGVVRVTFWGALAMAVTAAAGRLFGGAV
jgi:VIT1/CCC1 family predicted Fe2+/Mn2+ transporter